MVVQNPFSSLGPLGNFMYEGDTLGRKYYQGLANTKTYGDIFGMADDAGFNRKLGNIRNPFLNALGYGARGAQSFGQSLFGFTPKVGSVGIGGGTIPGRIFYEKMMKNPFLRTVGYGTRAFTGAPGILAATALQMKPGSALSKFIEEGPTNYERRQNELKEKQRQRQAMIDAAASRALTDSQAAAARREAQRGGRRTSEGLDRARERSKDAAAKATGRSRGFFGGR